MIARTKRRRPGVTETFSVSVAPETKRVLRQLADAEFGGNLSALVTDMAAEAGRRLAAGEYLRLLGVPALAPHEADALVADLEREVAGGKKRRKRRRAA